MGDGRSSDYSSYVVCEEFLCTEQLRHARDSVYK